MQRIVYAVLTLNDTCITNDFKEWAVPDGVYELILNTVRPENAYRNPIKSNETLFDMLVNKVGSQRADMDLLQNDVT